MVQKRKRVKLRKGKKMGQSRNIKKQDEKKICVIESQST